MKRNIITIDEERCDGCGACTNGCPEGALQLIDGKARLVGDLLCDGLGACIGTCPRGAISIEQREAEPYNEALVMRTNIIPKGENTILAHLEHLYHHGESAYLRTAMDVLAEEGIPIPQSFVNLMALKEGDTPNAQAQHRQTQHNQEQHTEPMIKGFRPIRSEADPAAEQPSALTHWPIQLHLINPRAPHFNRSNLLLAADCTAFSLGNFHSQWLKGKTLVIGCPKLDEGIERYIEKLILLIDESKVDTITVLRMHVPCCGGLVAIAQQARNQAKRNVPIKAVTVNAEGTILQEEWL
ncbi:MAG: ATP-binding protein [Spirochaetota bacterium]|jgi:NAD-dependent dihydropyrimidine dehydrogenase PreA subunit|uniref:ATP-binding protein n=1 Tax=Gracilinema caldarium TaxID=215591 RepID=UPI0026F00456|nr:4Fe-4S binding protein [Gracilinema caldarium]